MNFQEIEEVFKRLEGRVTQDEFISKVETKFKDMNGLCDPKTAAMLVASELGMNETIKIRDITPDKGNVIFIAKVRSLSDIREFSRDNNTVGRVANLNLADETGSIRAALWDEASDLVKIGDIKQGQTIKVKGYVRQGQRGPEINVGRGGNIEHVESEVNVPSKSIKINEIKSGMNDINILGKVIDPGNIRTFSRKDGKSGKVLNVTIGDETGKIRITLWDSNAESPGFNNGDTIEITNAYSRENTFSNSIELQLGHGGRITKSSALVNYIEPLTQIADIGIDSSCSVQGFVSGIDDMREFQRSDGTKSKVANIYISDKTGRIKAVLWGEHAELINEIDIGSEIRIVDAYAKSGRNEEVELSAGTRTHIRIIQA